MIPGNFRILSEAADDGYCTDHTEIIGNGRPESSDGIEIGVISLG